MSAVAAVSSRSAAVKPADPERRATSVSSGGLPPAEPGGVAKDPRGHRGDDSGSTSDGSGLARQFTFHKVM